MQNIIQGIIAVLLIVGGGVLSYLRPEVQTFVFPAITLIVGYYFGKKEVPVISAMRKIAKSKQVDK